MWRVLPSLVFSCGRPCSPAAISEVGLRQFLQRDAVCHALYCLGFQLFCLQHGGTVCIYDRADGCHDIAVGMGGAMRDLSHFGALPKGLAFEIEDLLLVKDWAELNDVRFAVRLDHGLEHEEYDEVIALQT